MKGEGHAELSVRAHCRIDVAGTVGYAGQFYNCNGKLAAPPGSVKQFDYFRQRRQQLGIKHMREQMDREALERKPGKNTCGIMCGK